MVKKDEPTLREIPGLTAMLDANPMAKAWMAMMSESTRFVTERLRHDIEMQTAMLACKTPVDLMKLQSEFYAAAMAQYMDETAKMFHMMSEATKVTTERMAPTTNRGFDDVPV
ncbi:MAG: phasin family protein [Pseudomonadota bacterium]